MDLEWEIRTCGLFLWVSIYACKPSIAHKSSAKILFLKCNLAEVMPRSQNSLKMRVRFWAYNSTFRANFMTVCFTCKNCFYLFLLDCEFERSNYVV